MSINNIIEEQKKDTIQVKHYFNYSKYEELYTPKIEIEKCICGDYPSCHDSCGGFNFYRYYSCDKCKLFATGRHQFPPAISDLCGENKKNEPKLFVQYDGEYNAENGWNELIDDQITHLTNEKNNLK